MANGGRTACCQSGNSGERCQNSRPGLFPSPTCTNDHNGVLTAVLVVLGPVLLFVGVLDLLRRRRHTVPVDAPAERDVGTVVACERRPGLESDRPVYGLRVVFTAPTGETVEFADNSTTARLVGTDVAVEHAPEAPWSAHVIDAALDSPLPAYGLIVTGGLATIGLVATLVS